VRALAVGNMYPPQSVGGYELLWRSAVEHMRAQGHEVRVLTTDTRTGSDAPDDPDVHRELRWYWRDHEFPRPSLRGRVELERHNAEVLDRHLSDLRPEVVSWWSMGGMSLSMLERVRRAGIPAAAFLQDHWLEWGPYVDAWAWMFAGRKRVAAPLAERLTGLIARIDFDHAARYMFGSEHIRDKALSVHPKLADHGIARSGIPSSFLDHAAALGDWAWRMIYVGRVDERKGIDTAVQALPHLPPEATLTIVGSWDEREEARLAERARGLGVDDRVTFAGQRDRDELPGFYERADVAVFPVRWEEPWGLVPLEAMAFGRPVVATGRGGGGEYMEDGDNCLLFPPDDPAALAAAIRRLADDPALRERLREGGLRTAPQYTEERFNHQVEQELTRAAGAAPEAAKTALA
jgi:glycosyltransferase involved in cell wall biosynthesis